MALMLWIDTTDLGQSADAIRTCGDAGDRGGTRMLKMGDEAAINRKDIKEKRSQSYLL